MVIQCTIIDARAQVQVAWVLAHRICLFTQSMQCIIVLFCSTDLIKEIRNFNHMSTVSSKTGDQVLTNMFDLSMFRLKTKTADSHANLNKAVLRVYKDANTTDKCSIATLQTTIFCRYKTMEITSKKINVDLSNGRNWEELDLTKEFKSSWPKRDVGFKIQVAVTLKSESADNSLPIKLLDSPVYSHVTFTKTTVLLTTFT